MGVETGFVEELEVEEVLLGEGFENFYHGDTVS
jgi:hypothetical protein